ncbi:RHS repeat-associated core domain-containing protein, partial [Pectobacterium versatile]
QGDSTQLHYIVTDLTGTARELCSEEGEIRWRGEQGLWGTHREERRPIPLRRYLGDAANEEVYCELRYQGQLYDAETGLYYNRHRYYDAESGQYLSPDPIGLAGGKRAYGYVKNPLSWVDPLGLTPKEGKNGSDKGPDKKNSRAKINNIEDIFDNPDVLKGHTPESLKEELGGIPEGWKAGTMNKSRTEDGFTLRELNERGNDVTDRYIQYHPGSRRHYDGAPYWKVSSGKNGTVRFPAEID